MYKHRGQHNCGVMLGVLIKLFSLTILLLHQSSSLESTKKKARHCPTSVCICIKEDKSITCDGKHLAHIPRYLPMGTKYLSLSKNEFTSLAFNMFNNTGIETTLETLIMYENKIKSIAPSSFEDMKMLKHLWLFSNNLTELKADSFKGLTNLKELHLSKNQITTIENGAFTGLKNLHVLTLWGNNLTNLNVDSFAGLGNLSNLALGDNFFETIPTAAFRHLTNLTTLEVLNLPIKRLQANAFGNLVHLEKLHIGDWGLLSNIDDDAFAGLPNLNYISLYRCNLDHVPSIPLSQLKNLKFLQLSNNPRIESLFRNDFQNLSKLEHLYLSNTGIHSLHESPFQFLSNLQVLDLAQNNISVAPNHLFLQQENLLNLNLSYNNIKVISWSLFSPLTKINVIDLSANQLICDCDIRWLKSLQEEKIKDHLTLKGKCSDPIKYSGKDIVLLPPRKFICEPPEFNKDKQYTTIEVTIGSKVMLPCLPDKGVPTPIATWTLPHKLNILKHTSPFKNGSWLIENVKHEDYGQYHCISTNKMGKVNITVVLVELKLKTTTTPSVPVLSKQHSSSALTGVLVTGAIVVVMVGFGVYVYKRRWYKVFRKGLYDAMVGDDEEHPMSKNTKSY